MSFYFTFVFVKASGRIMDSWVEKINNKSINKPNVPKHQQNVWFSHSTRSSNNKMIIIIATRSKYQICSLRTCGLFSLKDVRRCCIVWNGQLIFLRHLFGTNKSIWNHIEQMNRSEILYVVKVLALCKRSFLWLFRRMNRRTDGRLSRILASDYTSSQTKQLHVHCSL